MLADRKSTMKLVKPRNYSRVFGGRSTAYGGTYIADRRRWRALDVYQVKEVELACNPIVKL
jgi:hypothetical protein